MSTRCQIEVIEAGRHNLIYRHWDGYPSSIIPDLQKAAKAFHMSKLASAIIAQDIAQYEPCAYLDYHGDIKYLYILTVENKKVYLEVRTPTPAFWEKGAKLEDTKVALPKCLLLNLTQPCWEHELAWQAPDPNDWVRKTRVPSESTKGVTYEVTKHGDGRYSCQCESYKYCGVVDNTKTCKHIKKVQKGQVR